MTHADRYRRDDPDRKFLQSREWREHIRPAQLAREPLCRHCLALGRFTEADEVDHIERSFGNRTMQRNPRNFQSLCGSCHSRKSKWERGDRSKPLVLGTRLDGWLVTAPGGTVERIDLHQVQPCAPTSDAKPEENGFST